MPIIAIQVVTIAAITVASVALAAQPDRAADRRTGSTAWSSPWAIELPLTEGVLTRMHGLSGAHFVAYGASGPPDRRQRARVLERRRQPWAAFRPGKGRSSR